MQRQPTEELSRARQVGGQSQGRHRRQCMDEIGRLLTKYDEAYISDRLHTAPEVTAFATTFYKDVAELYDCITRVKNTQRNPSGYSLVDAPILGLLVRVWKLLKQVIRYYEEDNAEII